jgi:septal ring factor EnvC (AmiA/AmiB activator)
MNEMKTFYKKNDIGVDIEYSVVGSYKDGEEEYVIYTDFVEDEQKEAGLKLYVGKIVNEDVERIDSTKESEILSELEKELAAKLNG